MDVLGVEGPCGPLRHLIVSVWKDDERTYRIVLDNPGIGKWIAITVDVRELIREAVLAN